MRPSNTTLASATLALLLMCSVAASAEMVQGAVRVQVSDGSGGIVPGVTLVVTSADGDVLATGVTGSTGGYLFGALPVGPVKVTFELEGFETAVVGLVIQPGAESLVAVRLGLGSINETVVVSAKAPVDAPPPPAPIVVPVPSHDRESICGPAKPGAAPDSFGTIRSLRVSSDRGLYTKGDEIIIDGGTLTGLEAGQNLAVSRFYRVAGTVGNAATAEHTSGVLQIVSADERSSIGVVVYACDEFMKGDFLASFNPEPIRTPDGVGIPDYGDAARILFADAGQMLGLPRHLMVIDRGSDYGLRVGERLTLFHRQGAKTSVVGDAVVVALRADSATIRLERVSNVIESGDWAAPQHP